MKYIVEISSPPDREYMVAEIWQGDQMIAEIHQENGKLEVEIYMPETGQPLSVDYEYFVAALELGKSRLIGGES